MEDSKVIAEVLAGNPDAFGRLVERYQRQVYYFVVGKVAEHMEAQDLVQKSFVTAFQKLSQFETRAPFLPWVKGIALNHCRNEWRHYRRQATMQERLLEAKRAELELSWLEHKYEQGEARISALRECLQTLSQREQVLVDRRFVQELSMEAIGKEFGNGGEAVRLMLYRIRGRLAECVKRRMAFDHKMESA